MLIPYFAGSARQMLAQEQHWTSLDTRAPFALENVALHINKGESYHDDPILAARQLGWLWRYGWKRYQGLGRPVLDYEPFWDGKRRSAWRWCQSMPECLWAMMIEEFVKAKEGSLAWYNTRNRIVFDPDAVHVTRPAGRTEAVTTTHIERWDKYTDVWCIEPRQLDYGNVEAFAETRKPVALWLRDSSKEQIEVTVEVARAVRRDG